MLPRFLSLCDDCVVVQHGLACQGNCKCADCQNTVDGLRHQARRQSQNLDTGSTLSDTRPRYEDRNLLAACSDHLHCHQTSALASADLSLCYSRGESVRQSSGSLPLTPPSNRGILEAAAHMDTAGNQPGSVNPLHAVQVARGPLSLPANPSAFDPAHGMGIPGPAADAALVAKQQWLQDSATRSMDGACHLPFNAVRCL
jgi:hypothetical protein